MPKKTLSKGSDEQQRPSGTPEPAKLDYKVGRGKPPDEFKFKKGQPSPYPAGRPKGSKNVSKFVREIAYDTITVVTKSGERKRLSRIQASILRMANDAVLGNERAVSKFVGLVDQMELRAAAQARSDAATLSNALLTKEDLEVLRAVHTRMNSVKQG